MSEEFLLQENRGCSILFHSPERDAVRIYEKMGFRKSGNATKENGIEYVPMELALKGGRAWQGIQVFPLFCA